MAICQQKNVDDLDVFKDQIEYINTYDDYELIVLQSEEFLDKIADHGAELTGYYDHGRLKKIIKKVSGATADVITEYLFWNNSLFYVNYKQNPYAQDKDESGQLILDYTNANTLFESNHYYRNQKKIKANKKGKALEEITPEVLFLKKSKKLKSLLDNKYNNQALYDSLEGRWVYILKSDDYIVFEGTIQFNFKDGKFVERFKTKIENNILMRLTIKNTNSSKFKIKEVNETLMTLINIETNNEFVYAKVE